MNDYTKFNILGVELEFDFLDLDEKNFLNQFFQKQTIKYQK